MTESDTHSTGARPPRRLFDQRDSDPAAMMENLVLHVTESRLDNAHGGLIQSRNLMDMDGAIPLLRGLEGPAREDDEDVFLPASDFQPTSIGWWNAKFFAQTHHEDGSINHEDYIGWRMRCIPSRLARGIVRDWSAHMVGVTFYGLYWDGAFIDIDFCLGHNGQSNGKWQVLRFLDARRNGYMHKTLVDLENWDYRVRQAQSVCFARPHLWSASVGLEGAPRVTLLTDALGAQEIFRLRDVPSGKKRRDALLHWVSEHWRKNRKDPSLETKVRAHLRGVTEFTWNGLRVDLQPSQAVFERLDAARRVQMPRSGRVGTGPPNDPAAPKGVCSWPNPDQRRGRSGGLG